MSHIDIPNSLREINRLPVEEKEQIYASLIPEWVFKEFDIDHETFEHEGHRLVQFLCPSGSRALEVVVKQDAGDHDPVLYLNMADTFNNQLLVLLVVVNDPTSTRYNIDVDQHGNRTNFGTTGRNIPAELAAMRAGLAPGQIRRGLRSFKRTVPVFESFVSRMGHDMFLIEPLSYHNAIVFERYGFSYMRGLKEMQRIHDSFQEGGELYLKLDPENPFRHLDAWVSVRGRSWAIHDGILGHPFTGFQMYKRIGHDAEVKTFPNAIW
jgi:hypothetical protein